MRPQVCPRASAPRLLPSFRLAFPRPGPATKLCIIRIYLTSGVCCSCTKRIVRCTQGEDHHPGRPPWSPDEERFLGSRRLTSPTCRVISHVDPAAIFFPCQLVITDGRLSACVGEVQHWWIVGAPSHLLVRLISYPQHMPFVLRWGDAGPLRLAGPDRTQRVTFASHCVGPRRLGVRPPS